MENNPMLGVMIFVLGGLAGAVFYLPFKKVKGWAWESYWMVYAVFGLIIVPWALAFTTSPNVIEVLRHSPAKTLVCCCACGAMWGVGGLTWGLMIRYLGVGLGLAIGCGLCSAAGHAHSTGDRRSYRQLGREQVRPDCSRGRVGVLGWHRSGRHGRHFQGGRTAGGREEEGRRRVQLQEGDHHCNLLRAHELGDEFWVAGRSEHRTTGQGDRAGHLGCLEGDARSGRGAAGRGS